MLPSNKEAGGAGGPAHAGDVGWLPSWRPSQALVPTVASAERYRRLGSPRAHRMSDRPFSFSCVLRAACPERPDLRGKSRRRVRTGEPETLDAERRASPLAPADRSHVATVLPISRDSLDFYVKMSSFLILDVNATKILKNTHSVWNKKIRLQVGPGCGPINCFYTSSW